MPKWIFQKISGDKQEVRQFTFHINLKENDNKASSKWQHYVYLFIIWHFLAFNQYQKSKLDHHFQNAILNCLSWLAKFHPSINRVLQRSHPPEMNKKRVLNYSTCAIITPSWFETALDYKPRIFEEFPSLLHKLSLILIAFDYKPKWTMG